MYSVGESTNCWNLVSQQ